MYVRSFFWSSSCGRLGGYYSCMASTLRLSDEDDARLRALAEAEGRSKDEVVRLALADRWSRQHREQQLEQVLERVVPRYRGLLDRLGAA